MRVPELLSCLRSAAGARFALSAVSFVLCACGEDGRTELEGVFVDAVYPTADRLPQNLLRFYVYFSVPMNRETVRPAISLVDAHGAAMDGVFLDEGVELWSSDGTRLTLLLNPARIKSGLRARERLGAALVVGEEYTLVVDARARGLSGASLLPAHRKEFTVVAADSDGPDPSEWGLTAPRAGSRADVVVDVLAPCDHASLAHLLRVVDHQGDVVAGRVSAESGETVWRFTPLVAWKQGRYRLVVHDSFEDIAGNRVGRSFESKTGVANGASPEPSTLERSFDIR